jgi:hypothetical protein
VRVDLSEVLLLGGRGGLLGREEEVLPEVWRVHKQVGHLVHFLQVTANGSLLRLVTKGHLHELPVHLLVTAILPWNALTTHQLDLLPCPFTQLRLQLLALLGVNGLVLEDDLGVRVDCDSLE